MFGQTMCFRKEVSV